MEPEARTVELMPTLGDEKRIWNFVTSYLGTQADGRRLFVSQALDLQALAANHDLLVQSHWQGEPSGADWVHEIKHDGYRLIVRRDGPSVRLYRRNAIDWTLRLPVIATAARRIKAKSFTIEGEAVFKVTRFGRYRFIITRCRSQIA
jgi:ATP dependent DNA ligase domain